MVTPTGNITPTGNVTSTGNAAASRAAPAPTPEPPARLGLHSATFPAMGSTATISLTGPDSLLVRGRESVAGLETVWSRFLPTSMVSRLNAAAGRARRPVSMDVAPHTALLLHRARLAWQATGGLFDPTVLRALEPLGYDEDLAVVHARGLADQHRTAARIRDKVPATGMDGVYVDLARSRVTVPAGFCFDPGAIGKGLAADLVATDLIRHGAQDVSVNLGGDLRVMRSAAVGRHPGWHVALDLPMLHRSLGFHLVAGAAATSSTDVRTWTLTNRDTVPAVHHHLIDPRTGDDLPRLGPTEIVAATVVAGQAWLADAMATAALVAGADHAARMLVRAGVPAVLVEASGRVRRVGAMRRWLK